MKHLKSIYEFVVPMGISLKEWKKKQKDGITAKKYHEDHPGKKFKVVHGHKKGEIGKPLPGSTNLTYDKAMKQHKAIVLNENFDNIEKNAKDYLEHRKKLKEDPEYSKAFSEYNQKKIKEYWNELKPFKKNSDVPTLPIPLDEFFINKLIELGAISKNELEDGEWYYGECRNSDFGKWDEKEQNFIIMRNKFGNYYKDTCNHFEDDDGFDLFVPLRKANEEELKIIVDF